MTTLRVPARIHDEIDAHLRSAYPHEGVGLLATDRLPRDAGADVPVTAILFYPGTNVEASSSRFAMEPAEVIAALNAIWERNLHLGAIVHSHLAGPATPSPTDRREAYYPDALTVIVSYARPRPDIRAWLIETTGDQIEVAVTVD